MKPTRRNFLKGLGVVGVGLFVPKERLEFGVPTQKLIQVEPKVIVPTLEYIKTLDKAALERIKSEQSKIRGIPVIEIPEELQLPSGLYTVSMTATPGYNFYSSNNVGVRKRTDVDIQNFVRKYLDDHPEFNVAKYFDADSGGNG